MRRIMLFLVLAMGLLIIVMMFTVGQTQRAITPEHPAGQVLRDCAGQQCP